MKYPSHASCVERLKKIEGQVRGIARMIEDDRYCIDILIQIQAAKAALKKVEEAVLKDHADHCVAEAIQSGDADAQRDKLQELVGLISRFAG